MPLILLILIIIIFILAGTPFILNFVRDKITSAIQDQIGLPVRIGTLRGNLLYKTEIYNLKIEDVAEIKSISVAYNILALLSKKIEINSLLIDEIVVDLNRARELATIVKPNKEKEKQETEKSFAVSIKHIEIRNTKIIGELNQRDIKFSLDIIGRLSGQILFIEELAIKTERSNATIKGDIPLAKGNIFALEYSLQLHPEEFGIRDLSGVVRIKGRVDGALPDIKISNTAEIMLNYLQNQISGRIEFKWKMPYLDSLDFNAEISANTEKQGRWEITLKKKFTNLFAGVVSPYGNLRIPGSITGSFENPKFKGYIQGQLKFSKFQPRVSGMVIYQDSFLSISNLRLIDRDVLTKFNGKLNITKSEIIVGDLNVVCDDINLTNNFLDQQIPISGALNVNLKVKGKFDNPSVSGDLRFNKGSVYNEEIERADLKFDFRDKNIYLEKGLIQSPRGTLGITGNYKIADSSFSFKIYSEDIRFNSPGVFGRDSIPLRGNIKLEINLSGNINDINGKGKIQFTNFIYDKWTFGDCVLGFDIFKNSADIEFFDIKKSLGLRASVQLKEPYPFKVYLLLRHFEFTPYTELDRAFVTGNILANGELNNPIMTEAKVQIDTIDLVAQKNEILNSEPINIEIKDGLANIQRAFIQVQNHNISIQGQVPLDQKYGEINLKIRADHIEIGNLYAIFSKGAPPVGFFDLDVTVTGSLNAPDINGELVLEEIGYTLPDMVIASVSGLIKFQRDYFNIEYISGMVNNGEFLVNGFVRMGKGGIDTIAIRTLLKKLDYTNKEFGSFVISSSLSFFARKNSYTINGEITIDRAIYDKPFNLQTIAKLLTNANRPVGGQNKILQQIYCDIGINTPNGIKIANNVANVNVEADLQIKGFLSKINVYGTVKTSSVGTINYLGRKFEITNALIQFDNPYQINPVLDLEAVHFVSSVDGDYEITLTLSGTIEKWHLRLSSIPSVPEQDIISLLLIGRRRPGLYLIAEARDINLRGLAKDYAVSLARGKLERAAEKSLGFEKFTITGDLFEPAEWDIGFEKKIGKKITLIYGTGIESWEMRRIGLNYRLNDNFSIFTLHDQENMNSSVDLDLNFKIK